MSQVVFSRVFSFLVMSCFSLSVIAATDSSYTYDDSLENAVIKTADGLSLSGTTIKKRFFFNVYRLSHFMVKPKGDFPTKDSLITFILNANTQQRIELEFLRDVSREQIEEALMQGIEQNNVDADLNTIKKDIERLSSGFQDEVKKHSTLTISRLPSDKLSVFFNNNLVVETENKALANALWSIWFGKDPIVDPEDLIQNILAN